MYTHCPHCDTYFRVTSEQLKRAGGDVRCGRCFGTFNALQHLIDEPPERSPSTQEDMAPPAVGETTQQEPKARPPAAEKTDANIKRDHSQQLIEELQTRETGGSGGKRRLLWGLLSLPLALLLAVQYAYFNRDRLSQKPEYRPALMQLCQLAGCELPLIHAPQLIKLSQRDIRSHPDTRDILLVKATMINEAAFTQAFPVIELVLHDITGHTIAGRRFLPTEYLVDPSLSLAHGFASNSSVTIVLELVDPGAEAVGFEFQFL